MQKSYLSDLCRNNRALLPELFYQQVFHPDFSMHSHRHSTIEVMYTESGSFYLTLDNVDGKPHSVQIKQNELVLVGGFVAHCPVIKEGPCKILNVEFHGVDLPESVYHIKPGELYALSHEYRRFVDENWDFVVIRDDGSLRSIILEIQYLMECEQPKQLLNGGKNQTNTIMLQLLTAQFFIKCCTLYYSDYKSDASEYIRKAKEYITRNLSFDLTISDIANHVNISNSRLEVLFKKHMGFTITEYINNQRIQTAITYLNSTDKKIYEIAFLVGFNNRQHFNLVFRNRMNMSPKEYRQMSKLDEVKNYVDDEPPIVESYFAEE